MENRISNQSQSAIRSFFMNVVGVVCSIVLLLSPMVSSAQPTFYRVISTTAEYYNTEAKCIINSSVINDNRFLSVGNQLDVNALHYSGLGVWTGYNGAIGGTWKASRLYNRRLFYGDMSDYDLNYINQPTVTGYYGANPYTGHVATGSRKFEVGDPVVKHSQTWTTIIDPVTRATVWDHTVTFGINDLGGASEGVSAVRDEHSISDFFVLSKVADYAFTDNNVDRVGITRYTSVFGGGGHTENWSLQYAYPEYQLYPVSIVQNYYGDLTVVGNMVPYNGGSTCVFAFTVDRITGAVTTPLYRFCGGGFYDYTHLVANSATNHNGQYDEIVIAGHATPEGETYTLPMVMTLYPSGALFSCGVYRYKNNVNDNDYLTGQFNNAKIFLQKDDVGNTVYRLTAVGDIGDQPTYPGISSAIMMNAPSSFAAPSWTKTQGANLLSTMASSSTTAKWFVAQPDETVTPNDPLYGEYVYIGIQRNNGFPAIASVATGGLDKVSGASSACTNTPEFISNEQIFNEEELVIEPSEWGYYDDERTVTESVTHYPFYCTSGSPYSISPGKIGENVQTGAKPNEQATITLRYDNIAVSYTNTEENTVTVMVSDVLGNTLIQKSVHCPSGNHTFTLNAKELITGTYFVSLVSPTSRFNKNIVIIK